MWTGHQQVNRCLHSELLVIFALDGDAILVDVVRLELLFSVKLFDLLVKLLLLGTSCLVLIRGASTTFLLKTSLVLLLGDNLLAGLDGVDSSMRSHVSHGDIGSSTRCHNLHSLFLVVDECQLLLMLVKFSVEF